MGVHIFKMYIRHKMLQVSFHPLRAGMYSVQLCTFRNIKQAIGSKRQNGTWCRVLRMSKTFLLAAVRMGKIQFQNKERALSVSINHFHKAMGSDLVLCIICRMRRCTAGGGMVSKVFPSLTQHVFSVEKKYNINTTFNIQNTGPGKCRTR